MGNRTQKTDSATGTETYATDAANRLLSVSGGNPNNGAYTNDANGNTLTGGGKVNTWDSQNRLVKIVKAGVTSEFTYGADGLRRRSVVTNAANEKAQTDYVYDGQNMVAEVIRHFNGGSQVGQTENVSYLQGSREGLGQTRRRFLEIDGRQRKRRFNMQLLFEMKESEAFGKSLNVYFDKEGRDILIQLLSEMTEPGDHTHLIGPRFGGIEISGQAHDPNAEVVEFVTLGIPGQTFDRS